MSIEIYGIAIFDYTMGAPSKEFTQIAYWRLEDANAALLKMAESFSKGRYTIKEEITTPGIAGLVSVYGRHVSPGDSKPSLLRRYVVRKITIYGSPLIALAKQAE